MAVCKFASAEYCTHTGEVIRPLSLPHLSRWIYIVNICHPKPRWCTGEYCCFKMAASRSNFFSFFYKVLLERTMWVVICVIVMPVVKLRLSKFETVYRKYDLLHCFISVSAGFMITGRNWAWPRMLLRQWSQLRNVIRAKQLYRRC